MVLGVILFINTVIPVAILAFLTYALEAVEAGDLIGLPAVLTVVEEAAAGEGIILQPLPLATLVPRVLQQHTAVYRLHLELAIL